MFWGLGAREWIIFVAVLAGLLALPLLYLAPFFFPVSRFDADWRKTSYGWVAEETARRDTTYCSCPAYECETMFEGSLIARSGFVFRNLRYLEYPSGNEMALSGAKEMNRQITAKPYCLDKRRGELVHIKLVAYPDTLHLEIE